MYAQVKDLPSSLQTVLSSIGYGRADIQILPRESYNLARGSADGCRAFIVAVNLTTGERQITRGSWGGANIYNPQNNVDLDDTERPLPPGFAIVDGSEGGGRPVYASIAVNPVTLAPMLPAPATELTDIERRVLAWHKGLTSAGRKDEAVRFAVSRAEGYGRFKDLPRVPRIQTMAEIEAAKASLTAKGLIKTAKNGATTITTEGKNLADTRLI